MGKGINEWFKICMGDGVKNKLMVTQVKAIGQ
jgi:hypothetical protein